MRRAVYILFVILFFTKCSSATKEEKKVLERDKFIELLVKMYTLEGAVSGEVLLDEKNHAKFKNQYKILFNEFETDSLEVRNTFDSYKNKSEEMQEIMKIVINKLKNQPPL